MTLSMQMRLTRWGAFEDVDLPAIGAGQFKFAASYTGPSRLAWTCLVAQHTAPIPRGAFIRFWPDGTAPNGDPFSAVNPLFEGHVSAVEPSSESIGVSYTAFDPTWMATKMATLFDSPWPAGTPPDSPPVRPDNSVPRLVYNCRISNDPDWGTQTAWDGTIGEVFAGILEYTYHPLVWADAAPGDGTVEGSVLPYADSDYLAATFKVQEKIDFQSEGPRSSIERIQRYDPRLRLFFTPGSRLWRLHDITQSPSIDLTLNKTDIDFPVLSMQLRPSTEQCITAISIYGPVNSEVEEFEWEDPINPNGDEPTDPAAELTPLGAPELFQTFSTAGGMFECRWWREWQITDPDKRRGVEQFEAPHTYRMAARRFGTTSMPLLLVSYDRGNTYFPYPIFWNTRTGTIRFPQMPVERKTKPDGSSPVAGSTQIDFAPNKIKLIWAPRGEPLQVRRPETGYEGTAYTDAGLTVEDYQYDESLMIGREFGNPVTSPERRAAFEVYAQTLLDQRKDIVWTGGAQLDGLDYRFAWLNRRCRILAEDGSGNALSTGWEGIDAYVTDVEFDFEEGTTSLTFSADKLALFGLDSEQLKQRLNIKPMLQTLEYQTQLLFARRSLPSGKMVNEIVGVQTTPKFSYMEDTEANRQAMDAAQQQKDQFNEWTFGSAL